GILALGIALICSKRNHFTHRTRARSGYYSRQARQHAKVLLPFRCAGGCVKKNWLAGLAEVNKELLLILSIVASAGLINLLISGQRMALTIYNLPALFAAYYFGRRRAVEASAASILLVTWLFIMHPSVLGGEEALLGWSDVCI